MICKRCGEEFSGFVCSPMTCGAVYCTCYACSKVDINSELIIYGNKIMCKTCVQQLGIKYIEEN